MFASFTDGTMWSNIRMGTFFLGTCAIATSILSWTREESEEVIRAREIVEEQDRKNRLMRVFAFASSVAGLYGAIQLTTYIATRERRGGAKLEYEDLPQTEAIFVD